MDELDFVILKKLVANSRISFRELAEQINLTPAAVHKRVQKLVEIETIEAFIARPNVIALKGIWVGIWGTTSAKSVNIIPELSYFFLRVKNHSRDLKKNFNAQEI